MEEVVAEQNFQEGEEEVVEEHYKVHSHRVRGAEVEVALGRFHGRIVEPVALRRQLVLPLGSLY